MKSFYALIVAGLALLTSFPIFAQDTPITSDSAADVRLLVTVGRGTAYDVAWVDDTTILVASATNVWRYDLAQMNTPTPLFAGERVSLGVALHPDGHLIALCDLNETVVYRVDTLEITYRLPEMDCREAPDVLAFSPDGTLLATRNGERLVLWNAESGAEVRTLVHPRTVFSSRFLEDGTLVSRAGDGFMRWWNAAGHTTREVSVTAYPTALTADGAWLAMARSSDVDGVRQSFIAITDTRNEAPIQQLVTTASRYDFVAGKRLVSMKNGEIQLWDLVTGVLLASAATDDSGIRSVLASPNGQTVLVMSESAISVFDVESATVHAFIREHSMKIRQIAYTPDDSAIIANSIELRVYNAASLQTQMTLRSNFVVNSFDIAPDGTLVTNGREAVAERWSLQTGEHLGSVGVGGSSQSIDLSPDGETLVFNSHQAMGEMLLWDVTEDHELYRLEVVDGFMDEVMQVALSPDGQQVVSSTYMSLVGVWNLYGGASLAQLGPHEYEEGRYMLGQLVFSPDSQLLAYSEVSSGTVHLWQTRTRTTTEPLLTGCPQTWVVAFSPDGRLLATACDGDLQLWDVATREQITHLNGHSQPIIAMAFSSDGQQLVTGGEDGTLRVWGVE